MLKSDATFKLFLTLFFVLSLILQIPIIEPELTEEKIDLKQESTPNQITSSHIELWSSSSSLNPQIPFEDCILSDIVVDSSGNTYVSGTFTSQIGFGNITLNTFTDDYSIFIAKLSPSGAWDWAVQSLGDNAHSRAMTLDSNESKLYVVGNLVGNNSFGSNVASSVDKNMFVSSIDADTGEFKDIYTPSSSGISNAEAVIARTSGGVYVAGEYEVELNLPGIPSLPLSNGHTNAFVVSLSEQGWEWSTSTNCHLSVCGDENASSLTLDHNGNVAVLGIMAENTTFGAIGAAGSGPALLGAGFTDVFVWVINPVNASPINAISTNGIGIEKPAKIVTLGEELIVSGDFIGAMNLSGINVLSYSGATFSTGFVGSLTIDGPQETWNWVRTVNGSSDSGPTSGRFTLVELAFIPWQITDIDIGLNNTIIVGGEYWGAAQLDGLIMPPTGSITNLDAFVAQLSSQGDWLNMMIVGGPGLDGMTRVATSSNGQMHIGLDSDSVAITLGDSTHYPNDRSVIIGAFEWDGDKDSVSDYNDQCGGHDDRIDEDNDGIPDACDPLIDSDGDSISDTLDRCPLIHAGDLDEDGDGCPDEILVGCMDETAHNYTNLANTNSTTCDYDWDNDGTDDDDEIVGCMDETADNFDPNATDYGQCNFIDTPSCPDCEESNTSETNESVTRLKDEEGRIAGYLSNQDVMLVVGAGIGLGLIGGSVITRWLRPKTKGGSDHYFKQGVERQGSISTAADTGLDDYIEEDG